MAHETAQRKQEAQQAACPSCGMERNEWPDPAGVVKGGKTYCCEGCAEDTGCTCEE